MKTIRNLLATLLMMGLMAVGVSSQWQGRSRGTFQSVQQLIHRIENHADLFRNSLDAELQRSSMDDMRATTRGQENITVFMNDFEGAVRRLHERFDRRESNATDAQEVLNRASLIDRFMSRRQLDSRTQQYWTNLRSDLDQLANAYRVSWPASGRGYGGPGSYGNPRLSANRLTGTYQLDRSRSDDPANAADRELGSLPYGDQQLRDEVMRRLEAPEQIAIDLRGRTVTLASTRAPQITFEADGRENVETTPSGRTIRARATLNGNQLIVTTNGDTNNQFTVTFDPLDYGQRLNVTRRVYVDRIGRSVTSQSTYTRTSEVALFNIYTGPQGYPADTTARGDFIVRSGETVVAELLDPLSTVSAREGDRFTMRVRQPAQYAGATIEGHVSNVRRSGRLSGRAEMTFNFDTIRLRNGNSYRFAGIVERVNTPNGETAQVDNEGAVSEESQTRKTAERAAIGTAVGAIIGAIAGGGKGAAIGAVIGAGSGAGSVYVQGRDDLELTRGTEITIQATGSRQ